MKKSERNRISIHWFPLQMVAMAKVGPGWSQELHLGLPCRCKDHYQGSRAGGTQTGTLWMLSLKIVSQSILPQCRPNKVNFITQQLILFSSKDTIFTSENNQHGILGNPLSLSLARVTSINYFNSEKLKTSLLSDQLGFDNMCS